MNNLSIFELFIRLFFFIVINKNNFNILFLYLFFRWNGYFNMFSVDKILYFCNF